MTEFRGYLRNPRLKNVGVNIQWDEHLISEYKKCKDDPIYFTRTYMKLINLDRGLVPFEVYPYQENIIKSIHENRYTVVCTSRQAGKTSAFAAYILHHILFNKQQNIAIVANKGDIAKEILSRIKLAYEHLPMFLQQGVKQWNQFSIVLENDSRIIAAATSSSTLRGYSFNVIVCDEAAHIEHFAEFFASVFPTISSGKNTKVVLVSTPNGMNEFYSIFTGAPANGYNPIQVHWSDVPGRDIKWKEETLAALGNDLEKFAQEFENEFHGSSGTLISGWCLKKLFSKVQTPIYQNDGLYQYNLPEKGRKYAMSCDVSHGKGLDYSAFHVIDVTEMPFRQVCVFHDNRTTPTDYAQVIFSTAVNYNNALLLIEVNDIGTQVADIIFWDHGYENIVMTATHGNKKIVVSGFGGRQAIIDRGIRTTLPLKNSGCALIKLLMEQDKLVINHEQTIMEFATFSKKNKSWEAEEGRQDDLAMGLVLFAWLSVQTYFKDYIDLDTLSFIRNKTDEEIYEELLPFGFISKGDEPEYVPSHEPPPVKDVTADLLRQFDFDIETTNGPNWLR